MALRALGRERRVFVERVFTAGSAGRQDVRLRR